MTAALRSSHQDFALAQPQSQLAAAKEELMETIADLIDRVLTNADDEKVIAEVRREVNEMMNDYPMFAW